MIQLVVYEESRERNTEKMKSDVMTAKAIVPTRQIVGLKSFFPKRPMATPTAIRTIPKTHLLYSRYLIKGLYDHS